MTGFGAVPSPSWTTADGPASQAPNISAAAIAVMKAGRIVFTGAPEALIAGARGRCWDWTIAPAQLPAARQAFVVSQSIHRGASVQVRVLENGTEAPKSSQSVNLS